MQTSQRADEITLQDRASAPGEGNILNVRGSSVAVLTVSGPFSASIAVESNSNRPGEGWVSMPAISMDTGKSVSTLAVGRYLILCKGVHQIRAHIVQWESGEVTIVGRAVDSESGAGAMVGAPESPQGTELPQSTRVASQTELPPAVTEIGYPAYMVNRNWDVEWINDKAEELIFGRPIRKIPNIEDRHFFKLVFTTPVRDMVTDFDAFVKSHLPLIQGDLPIPSRNPILLTLRGESLNWLERMWPREVQKVPPIDCREETLRFRQAAVQGYHRVAAIFREGILIIWIPGIVNLTPIVDLLTGRQHIITDLLIHKLPTLQSMAVLVADLQSSVKVCADLPPEEYFALITDLWTRLEHPFRQYGGSSGKHVGDGVVRYFLAKRDNATVHTLNALLCAEAIRQCMAEIDAAWKTKKNWLNHLVLNMGLHEGREWFGYIPSLPAPEFTALGDTVNIAARLTGVARNGALWITKQALSSLPSEVMEHIVYGIRRGTGGDEHFLPSTYSRVVDLPEHERIPKAGDIANLAVTEIVRLNVPAIQDYLRSCSPSGTSEAK